MDRRQYLTALGATAGVTTVAGCLGGDSSETIVDGVAGEDWKQGHEFTAEADDVVRVKGSTESDGPQYANIYATDGGGSNSVPILSARIDVSNEYTATLSNGGTYTIEAGGENTTITVTVK